MKMKKNGTLVPFFNLKSSLFHGYNRVRAVENVSPYNYALALYGYTCYFRQGVIRRIRRELLQGFGLKTT